MHTDAEFVLLFTEKLLSGQLSYRALDFQHIPILYRLLETVEFYMSGVKLNEGLKC